MSPVAEALRISKRFFGTQALDDVSFDVGAHEVHALVGENGAGKSTLIKILSGIHAPDAGEVRIDGRAVRFNSPRDALNAGIVVIPQEMRVVPALSVADNVLLGRTPIHLLWGLIPTVDRRAMHEEASRVLARLNFETDLDRPIGELNYGERQLVVIAKALSNNARVLILDEPTASLEHREVRRLFDVIETLKKSGVAIVFISHRLDEVVELGDRVTVLRDGRVVDVFKRGRVDVETIVREMTGRDLEELHRPHDLTFGETLLSAERTDQAGRIDGMKLRAREVVGLAGLLGSGTTEYLLGMFGAVPKGAPRLTLRGTAQAFSSPAAAIEARLGMVAGERAHGLIYDLSVRDNIVLPHLPKFSEIWRRDEAGIDAFVAEVMEAVDIRPRDPAMLVRSLSGGNQQKVLFARWLAGHADVLLLDEPTHGIDIAAKAQIHRLMRRFAADGGGIVFASSESNEVLSISDSVLAMRNGKFVAHMTRDDDYNERSLRAALGG